MALAEAAELIARKLREPGGAGPRPARQGQRAALPSTSYAARRPASRRGGRACSPRPASRPRSGARSAPRSSRSSCSASIRARRRRRTGRARSSPRAGDDLRLARLELNVGNVYHRQDRFAEALRSYEQAYERLLPHRQRRGHRGGPGQHGDVPHQPERLPARPGDAPARARVLRAARNAPAGRARPTTTSPTSTTSAASTGAPSTRSRPRATHASGLGDAYLAALCQLDLAEIYLELNLSADAAEMAEQAMAGFRRLRIGYEAAKALAYLAIAHGQQGKVLRALELCAEARALFVAEQNSVWPALLDLYQALILFGAGRLFESRRHCVAALESFRSPALASKAILCRLLLARLALRMGDARRGAPAECDAAGRGALRPRPARARLPAPLREGPDRAGGGRPGARLRRLPARPALPGDAPQQPPRRGAEDRVHEEQARGLRGAGRPRPRRAAATGTASRRRSPTWSRRSRAACRSCCCARPRPSAPSPRARASSCAGSATCARSSTGTTTASRPSRWRPRSARPSASRGCRARCARARASCCACCASCRRRRASRSRSWPR